MPQRKSALLIVGFLSLTIAAHQIPGRRLLLRLLWQVKATATAPSSSDIKLMPALKDFQKSRPCESLKFHVLSAPPASFFGLIVVSFMLPFFVRCRSSLALFTLTGSRAPPAFSPLLIAHS